MFILGSLATVLFASKGALVVRSAFGFATGTTGGAAAAAATPTSTTQLASWLLDGTARTIVLNRTYDFTDSQGSTTATGCKPWTCSPNPQLAINANNWCAADAAKVQSSAHHGSPPSSYATQVTITYKNAGTSGLPVDSNNTIMSKGTCGWIKGKGLQLVGSKNVIIQNICISDIDHQFVWGGDAIDLKGASNIWVDHNYFNRVGRQFIVTHFDASTKVTISNNYFDGQSDYSTGCDKRHYWAFLMLGKGDQITFARNQSVPL